MSGLVNKASLAVQVRDMIAARVADGTYPPGHRLIELSLAKEFGTSQAPVREALRMLEALQLVESTPHRGARVRFICEREQMEANFVRGAIEEAAARVAGPHFFAQRPTAITCLRAATSAMRTALTTKDAKGLAHHNAEFHRQIVQASGCGTLIKTWVSLGLEERGALTAQRHLPEIEIEEVLRQHEAITVALAAGDGQLAGRLLNEHALWFTKLHGSGPDDWAKAAANSQPA
jgi:DNA-binding GntR family transcriptional regulator